MGNVTTTAATLTTELEELRPYKSRFEELKLEKEEQNRTLIETFGALSEAQVKALEAEEARDVSVEAHQQSLAKIQASEKDLEAALERHTGEMEAVKGEHLEALNKLKEDMGAALEEAKLKAEEERKATLEELQRVKVDLEGQESKYNEQIEAAKKEHNELLAQAFEEAKVGSLLCSNSG